MRREKSDSKVKQRQFNFSKAPETRLVLILNFYKAINQIVQKQVIKYSFVYLNK